MTVWRPDQPYNNLPLLPPITELETHTVLKQAAELIHRQEQTVFDLPKAGE